MNRFHTIGRLAVIVPGLGAAALAVIGYGVWDARRRVTASAA